MVSGDGYPMGMLCLPVTPSIPILYARTEDNVDTRQTRRRQELSCASVQLNLVKLIMCPTSSLK